MLLRDQPDNQKAEEMASLIEKRHRHDISDEEFQSRVKGLRAWLDEMLRAARIDDLPPQVAEQGLLGRRSRLCANPISPRSERAAMRTSSPWSESPA